MAGLLDVLNSDDGRMALGLLAAAGPSAVPQSFGQRLLGGMQTANNMRDQDIERQLKQQGMGLDMQLKKLQLGQMQGQIDRMNAIRDETLRLEQSGQMARPGMPQAPFTSSAFTPEYNAQRAATMPQSAPASSGGNITDGLTARLVQQAGIYAKNGELEQANKLYEQAAKFMPEVKEINVSMQNGQPVNVITYKNGKQEVSGFSPTPKLHFADQGSAIVPMDEYTGLPVNRGLGKSASPDSILSANVTMRGQNMTDARDRQLGALSVYESPQFGPMVIDKVTQRTAPVTTLQGGAIPGPDQYNAAKRTDQLAAGIAEARKLIPVATSSGAGGLVDKGLGFFGKSTDSGDAAAKLDTIAGWMTANVPRMEGPQSDRDVMQYKIMAARVGDRSVPVSQRLAALDALEGLQNKYAAINQRSPFGGQAAAPAEADPLGIRSRPRQAAPAGANFDPSDPFGLRSIMQPGGR